MEGEVSQVRGNYAANSSSYVDLRLNVTRLHENIYNFLRGCMKTESYDAEKNMYVETVITQGFPLANEIGIQNIMNFVTSLINEHTMQGNKEKDDLNHIMHMMHLHLAEIIMQNTENWDILPRHRHHIVRSIMYMSGFVLSRTIDNKERESYSPTIERTSTIYAEKEGGKRFGII